MQVGPAVLTESGTLPCFLHSSYQPRAPTPTYTLLLHLLFSFAIFFFFFFARMLSQIQMNAAFMAKERILAGRRRWEEEEQQGGEENGIQSSGT